MNPFFKTNLKDFTLLPKVFLLFFSRLQNVYFLIIILIQVSDEIQDYYE